MFDRICNSITRLFNVLPKFNNSYGEECPICLEIFGELENKNDLCTLRCGHSFHIKCVSDWALKDPTCPTCRGKLKYHFPH
jgi:hypothetical protein